MDVILDEVVHRGRVEFIVTRLPEFALLLHNHPVIFAEVHQEVMRDVS